MHKGLYAAGLQCERRLWQQRHAPGRARAPGPGELARLAEGRDVGRGAWSCFPGGVLVEDTDFAAALARTRALLADRDVPALFEAAFEHEGVRVRADVIERLPGGRFGLREVKASASLRPEHMDDVALQLWVLRGAGLPLASLELWLVDAARAAGPDGPDWPRFFARREVLDEAAFLAEDVAGRLREQRAVLAGAEPPVEPGPHCRTPRPCEFLEHCTRGLGPDWIGRLPGIRAAEFEELRARGARSLPAIPGSFPLKPRQARAVRALRESRLVVEPGLGEALAASGPPAAYLDFEATSSAVPLFPGTTPFQPLPFQWSLHRVDAAGALAHREFLAPGGADPRRPFAESLLEELGRDELPVHVYSGYEAQVLESLAGALPDLAEPLRALAGRLVDLLEVVREHVYAPEFAGSFSIKRVAPALVPGFSWDDLPGIADGAGAALAVRDLLRGGCDADTVRALREKLRAYCERDTLALVELHRVLRSLAERG